MSDSREAELNQAPPQQVAPQQVAPQVVAAPNTKCLNKVRKQCIILIVLSLLTFLANLGLCAYYTYMSLTRYSRSYYYGSGFYYNYSTSFYTWRAGLCGAVAFISLCILIFAIVKHRRTKRKLRDSNQYVTQGVTYVYQGNMAPVFYPPPGAQWQQQPPQPGYVGMPYSQPAYGPLPPGQQPIQFPQPMQQQQPANPSQV